MLVNCTPKTHADSILLQLCLMLTVTTGLVSLLQMLWNYCQYRSSLHLQFREESETVHGTIPGKILLPEEAH